MIADPVVENRYYFTRSQANQSDLYISDDGGATWTEPTREIWDPHKHRYQTRMTAVTFDGTSSEIWVGSGNQGLWRSTDGGVRFEKTAPDIVQVEGIGFGAPLEEGGEKAMYVVGVREVDGVREEGMFLSTNRGDDFRLISPEGYPMFEQKGIVSVGASHSVPGQVFVGTSGFGVIYGRLLARP